MSINIKIIPRRKRKKKHAQVKTKKKNLPNL
jgi:hypothetical protein